MNNSPEMKLLIVLSLIACSHAAKLDRTYLPPASAASAGGSPGSLNTPIGSGPSGDSSFGPSNTFAKTSGALSQGVPSSQYGQPVGPSFDVGFGQPAQNFGGQSQSFSGQGQAQGYGAEGQSFRGQAQTFGGQAQSFGGQGQAFSGQGQAFSGQAQNFQRNQPERASASADRNAETLRFDSQNDGNTFSYNFETSNGIAAEESGVAANGVQAQGAFSYSGDDGQVYRVAYTADENGYQPQGDHLPTPHPIPEEILKSIEQNARAAAAGTQEGAYNPNEDNSSGPQGYSSNAPTSYNQGPASSNSAFNQAQGSPSSLYGAPNAGARPQGFQAPSNQYGSPATAASFNQPQIKSPSQGYGAPSGGSRPNQYQAPSAASNGFAPSSSAGPSSFGSSSLPASPGFGPSGESSSGFGSTQARPNQAGQFSQPSAGQAQDDGYEYNRPQAQASGFGRDSNPSSQYRPQNSAPSFGQSPNGLTGPKRFGPASRPDAYGAASNTNTVGAKGNFGSSGQGSFSPAGNSIGPFGRPQGQSQSMADGYQYNNPGAQGPQGTRPGNQGPQGQNGFRGPQAQGPQSGFQSAPGQNFGAPRQPPSFSEEDGYKY